MRTLRRCDPAASVRFRSSHHYAAPSFANFGIKGTLAIYDSSAVFGFEVPTQTRGYNDRNFKSTALARENHMATFKAIVIEKTEAGPKTAPADFDERYLMEGDVTVRVEWSTLNYKDGLAITGKAPVVRRFPMIPGIDFAGTVETSTHADWKAGDKVVLNGCLCWEPPRRASG